MNIAFSILVKPLGMVTFVKTVHSPNAELPILVTALGIVMFVKLVHPKNAPLFNPVRTRDPVRIFYKYNIINIIF